jgi:hypothetical protein
VTRDLPAEADHTHTWTSTVFGYLCQDCNIAVLDTDVRALRKEGNRSSLYTLLNTAAEYSTVWVNDLNWWTHR